MDRAGRPLIEKPQATASAVVLASYPDGRFCTLNVRIRWNPEGDMVGEALGKAMDHIIARTERLRGFEVLTVGGNPVAILH